MKILVISNLWPNPFHSIRAANIVIYQLVKELSNQPGLEIGFLKISRSGETSFSEKEKKGISLLKQKGVQILEPLNLPDRPKERMKIIKMIKPRLADFYPEISYFKIFQQRVESFSPDILFIPWSEWVTALAANLEIPKFAYYGNPDPKAWLARLRLSYHCGEITRLKFLLLRNLNRRFEKIHLEVMAKYEILGNVAANDAEYYSRHGHPNAFYIQNLWIDRFGEVWKEKRKQLEQDNPVIIVGNLGKLTGIANQYGFEIMVNEFLDYLKKEMQGKKYEIHLFGSDKPYFSIEKKLKSRPEVKMRGFVSDIDKEIFNSKLFLCLNNGSDYKVGHTRYLHAWSLGSCLVAHSDVRLSMPEIIHNKNALLGRDSLEIAKLVVRAVSDDDLRLKIGEQGYKTFREYFTAKKVVSRIIEKINEYFLKK